MHFKILGLMSLVGSALAVSCHKSNDDIGRTCQFNPANAAFMNAALLYCYQFRNPITVPKGSSSSNVYQIKIANVPDGWQGHQIFWGNYKVEKGDATHTITYNECMDFMRQIDEACDGYGGWVDTAFGTVFGECIRQ